MKIRDNPLVCLFRKTWEYSAGNRKAVVGFWTLFIAARSIDLFCQPLIWVAIIKIVQNQGVTADNLKLIWGFLFLNLGIEVFFWCLHGPGRIMERKNAFKARINYRKILLKGVITLPMEWHVDHHSGDTIDKVEKGTTALYKFAEDSFEVIYAAVQFIGSFIVIAYFSREAAGIVLAMVCVTVWITMRFDRTLLGQYRELNQADNKISEGIFDAVSNIMTVIILRVGRLVYRDLEYKIEKPLELFDRNIRIDEFKWFLTNMCCTVMTIAVVGYYLWDNIGTPSTVLVGSLYLLLRYLTTMSEIFFRFTSMYGDILQYRAKVANAEELSKDFRPENFTNHVLAPDWKRLEIRKLNFSYQDERNQTRHLSDVSLVLGRGEAIALVGESGSGKSTCLKLMRGLYYPESLELIVDGVRIPQGFAGIAQDITLVPQDPEIFATTLLKNITLGAEYDMAFVKRFTDMACVTDTIENLPKAFDSLVREKGVNLSGGQQQRLALARGLLACHDKNIALLDEPTSSLDKATEMRVYANIFREFRGKTIVSTVHQLHLLPLFHRIYMFDGGRIIGSGGLEELLASCDKFRVLWDHYVRQQTGGGLKSQRALEVLEW